MTETSETIEYTIECTDVLQCYPDKKGGLFTVLNDIDIRVQSGTFLSLVGPSGSGKSTFSRLILGSEPPFRGQVLINGQPVQPPDRNRGMVFQSYSLFPHLTVVENVMYGQELEEINFLSKWVRPFTYYKKKRYFKEKAMEYLDRVQLSPHADKYPFELSGGMRQRVAIAQAMIMKPDILLMDEPFGALDPDTRESLQVFLLEMHEKTKMTVLFITHDLEEALYLCSRLIVLSPFYVVDSGTTQGSKIVIDIAYPGRHPKSLDDKYTPYFNERLKMIREKGFNPDVRQHIGDFNLEHSDSWRTLSSDNGESNQTQAE
ncbi:ABC transporter ATP-binding protein [candidate division CSSED10-310 bacterium]|uniref:ABC transporter ATP-binding protein n=1 Tax=candidate division CSSED10-310 bacterium TaxID=2855610 RepID=A0ABV6Z494_UNCC1